MWPWMTCRSASPVLSASFLSNWKELQKHAQRYAGPAAVPLEHKSGHSQLRYGQRLVRHAGKLGHRTGLPADWAASEQRDAPDAKLNVAAFRGL